jgi:hypothetical protein
VTGIFARVYPQLKLHDKEKDSSGHGKIKKGNLHDCSGVESDLMKKKKTQRSIHLVDSSSITHATRLFLLCGRLLHLQSNPRTATQNQTLNNLPSQELIHASAILENSFGRKYTGGEQKALVPNPPKREDALKIYG